MLALRVFAGNVAGNRQTRLVLAQVILRIRPPAASESVEAAVVPCGATVQVGSEKFTFDKVLPQSCSQKEAFLGTLLLCGTQRASCVFA